LLHTSFHKHGFGAGALTTKDAQDCIGGAPAPMVNHAQFVIVEPTVALEGIVKFTSKYLHCVGSKVDESVTVTMFPANDAFKPEETAPIESPVSVGGIVSMTVSDDIGRLPVLQIQI